MKTKVFAAAAGIAILAALLAVQSWMLPRLIVRRLEKALGIQIESAIRPLAFRFAFVLEPARLKWKDKVSIRDGSLRVDYGFEGFNSSGRLRLRLEGRALAAQLLGDWQSLSSEKSFKIDRVLAEFIFDSHGIQQIQTLDVSSPSLSLKIGTSQKPTAGNPPARTAHEA